MRPFQFERGSVGGGTDDSGTTIHSFECLELIELVHLQFLQCHQMTNASIFILFTFPLENKHSEWSLPSIIKKNHLYLNRFC